jgi:predicted SAM-dependent methyltransferase
MANSVLQCAPDQEVMATLAGWRRTLQAEGEICIMVPSLEWAARQIRSEKPSPMTLLHLYGPTADGLFHKTGFTMRRLRAFMEQAGFAVSLARVNEYTVVVNDEEVSADMLTVIGMRKDD